MFEKLLQGIMPVYSGIIMLMLVFAVVRSIMWAINTATPGKRRGFSFAIMAILGFGLFAPFAVQPVAGAATSNSESISIEQLGLDGITLSFVAKNLKASTYYQVGWSDGLFGTGTNTTLYTFKTASSGETSFLGWAQINSPTEKVVQLYLISDADGTMDATTYLEASKNIVVESVEVLIPQTPLTEVIVAILILTIVVSVLVGLRRRF